MSFDKVKEFNTTYEVVVRDTPNARVPEARLRFRLIKEEFGELLDAIEDCDIIELADALGDIEYVVVGASLVFGIGESVLNMFDEVNEALINGTFDLETNPLILREGHEIMLKDVRDQILTNDIEALVESFASILALVAHTADHYDIDLEGVIDAVHTSNMTKLGEDGKPIFREGDRKVLKGPNYKTPTDDINRIVFGSAYAPTGE